MQISHVRLKNFRAIKEKEIDFKQGFNLIKGENGKGKTSILEAIAVGLGGFIAGTDVATRHFSVQEIRKEYPLLGDGSIDEKKIVPLEVEITATVDGQEYTWLRSRSSVKASRSTIQPRDIARKAEKIANDSTKELPIILYESASRVWSQKRSSSDNIFRKNYFRTAGYTDALVDDSNIKLLLNWCVKMEQVAWQNNTQIAEYEAVKAAVGRFMQEMNQSADCKVFYDRRTENLMYQENDTVYPINDLSAGYQSLAWMVFDIAYRMAILNPEKKADVANTSGVILIDEIDMHLHPRWQWNIIDALRTVFPNVQFIAATHAPILFASAKNVWIIDVEEEEIQYSVSHYGLDVNNSLEQFQETQNVNPKVQAQIDHFMELFDAEKYEDAEKVLDEIRSETEPEHPKLVELETMLRLEMMDLGD
ncbi:MAG: AAA family ATPase [Clostridiales bacterium]|nr:AAA family ATPase [Clostridiales bacterium]